MTSDVHVLGQAMVVTGLEDAPPPVLIKVRQEMRRPEAPFLVWVRDEDRDDAPLWLVSARVVTRLTSSSISSPVRRPFTSTSFLQRVSRATP